MTLYQEMINCPTFHTLAHKKTRNPLLDAGFGTA